MRITLLSGLAAVAACAFIWPARAPAAAEDPLNGTAAAALAEGYGGVIVGTSGAAAVQAGLEALKQGGSAADAAVTAALAQVVECGGAYVSFAGIFGMIYYDAETGEVSYLNACFNTPLEEKEPHAIPGGGRPSGRTALVPGFMAGVQAAHDRFGKLPRQAVFAPASAMAADGIRVGPLLNLFLRSRRDVLSRLPETKQIFTKEDGSFYAEGELFRQPALAETLRQVAEQGAGFMYTGKWAEEFVAAVAREGGKITLADLEAYRVVWEEPLRTTHRGCEVCAPGLTGTGGVAMLEALNLLELAGLSRPGEEGLSPESLFWLMQIGFCQVLGYLPPAMLKEFVGLDLSPASRVTKQTAAAVWQHMQAGTWPFAQSPRSSGAAVPASHSDGIVAADRFGNVAAVTHSINTTLWGDTGIFVAGVSIPDSAAFQQDAMAQAGPGRCLPDPLCPLLVLRDGKPVLASSAIGGGLHQKAFHVLANVLNFGMDSQAAVEAPAPLLPDYAAGKPAARVEAGHFDQKLLDAVIALGQEIETASENEAGSYRGYWVGIAIDPASGLRRGIGTRKPPLPSIAASESTGRGSAPAEGAAASTLLEWIRPSADGTGFVAGDSGARFIAWGFNYDHDASGRLLEDYWNDEWPAVTQDFQEMKALGANVVRIHLQVARFMKAPDEADAAALAQLGRVVRLAEDTGLHLDVTGLGCYHKQDVPAWYDAMDEAGRWGVQSLFWQEVAKTCAKSPAIFCYDLMNEPILPGAAKETDWLAGEFAGKYFVQRITLDLAGRTREEVAKAWVERLAAAIRKHDGRHMITVGAIPWAYTFPGAKPLFYAKEVGANLDFASVHFYPKKGDVQNALAALAVYNVGKPLVVEEMFPLECGLEELDAFVEGSRPICDGWIGFYWGKTIEEYSRGDTDLAGAITKGWLEYFRKKGQAVLSPEAASTEKPAQ